MTRIIVNIMGFQAGWFACILGAANGLIWLGPVVVLAVLGANLALNPARSRELLSIGAIATTGTAVDTAFHLSGLITFEAGGDGPVSAAFVPWIAALWVNFSATLSVSLRWLARFPLLASILGVASGPGTYYLGVKLGAIGFFDPTWVSFLALAAEWSIALPAALVLSRRIYRFGVGEGVAEEARA